MCIKYTVGVLSGQRRHADVASKSAGRNPNLTSRRLPMAPLSFMKALPICYPSYRFVLELDATRNRLRVS